MTSTSASLNRHRPFAFSLRRALTGAVLGAALAGAACGSGAPAGGAPAAMGPVPVGIETLTPHPVDQFTEFVATLRSRRSSEIRPQVDGIITRIFVHSGDRVSDGQPLIQIDPAQQQAAVASDEAQRVSQEAAVQYAKQELDRQQKLYAAGLVSKQALDQASTAYDTARASLNALSARERESQVQLRYYRVSAPTAGIVGDIPVRVGDRVTTSTVLTTIDQNAGLEAYVYVPVERSHDLRPGMPLRLVDERGTVLADTAINFVSPQVDDRTQAILVKAPVPAGRGFRTEQFVRARLVWSSVPSLTVPVLAVSRINGQYFVFVAEAGDKGLVARQRPVQLGDLVGNEYVVQGGLTAGERIVTSGVQKIADGVPVTPVAAPPAAAPPAARG